MEWRVFIGHGTLNASKRLSLFILSGCPPIERNRMLRRASGTGAAIALLLVTGAAAAQAQAAPGAGTIEIGAFGQWTWFDANAGRPDIVPEDGWGYGGRLGFFLSERFQIEGDGWYSPQDRSETDSFCCTGARATDVNASAFAARLNYNHPMGALMGWPSQLILGAGAVRTTYAFAGGTSTQEAVSSIGATGLAGLRIGVANHVAIRLDGVVDHMPNHEPAANTNVHARAGVSLLFGGARPVAMVAPAPAPAPAAPTAPAAPVAPAAPAEMTMQVCVVDDGMLRQVSAIHVPSRRDTLVMVDGQRRAFSSVHPASPPTYAAGASWYTASDAITLDGQEYVRYGLPRVIGATQLDRIADYQGTAVFAEQGAEAPHTLVYLPLRPGCEFQPYQQREAIRVRG